MTRVAQPHIPGPGHLLEELSSHLTSAVAERIPPRALFHLLLAQKELLLAINEIVEHNANGNGRTAAASRRPAASARTRKATPGQTARAKSQKRPKRITVE